MYDPVEDIKYGTRGEFIADVILVRDNIDVKANGSSNEDFWFMLVEKCVHGVKDNFIYASGNSYLEGEMVVQGYWYDIFKLGSCTYILKNDKPIAHVYSHLVLASKFSLPPIAHGIKGSYASYELDGSVIDIISDTLDQIKLLD
jgi:hypothetical protein